MNLESLFLHVVMIVVCACLMTWAITAGLIDSKWRAEARKHGAATYILDHATGEAEFKWTDEL